MKKFLSLVLALVCVLSLFSCQQSQPENTDNSSNTTTSNTTVLKAWSGEFSEEKLKSAINEYQNNFANITLEKGGILSISFETDFEVSSCSVSRLSRVDDTDMQVELNSYIDLFVETDYDGKMVTVASDWWCTEEDSWVNDYFIWAYLVRVKDTNGTNHYYYFRVDYSACAHTECEHNFEFVSQTRDCWSTTDKYVCSQCSMEEFAHADYALPYHIWTEKTAEGKTTFSCTGCNESITFISEVGKFSYTQALEEYKVGDPGVKHEHFNNRNIESEITGAIDAIIRAEFELTIEYDTISVSYDETSNMWRVDFWTLDLDGNSQSVYINGYGLTCYIVYGE